MDLPEPLLPPWSTWIEERSVCAEALGARVCRSLGRGWKVQCGGRVMRNEAGEVDGAGSGTPCSPIY